ncbi:microsomal glutathione S-transferase 1-like isoform X2 [Episyrphus balteatus]|uniref:microsomal glutathione S-transferase 1-like isoform X2 n=1 Tax=Episyrphus balteatus TaxID=286459 RepID=UPI0024853298|nr:microsomal glutathione S-transferase 1-like isoform X2 [Episyrphus balteatus]
MNNTTTTTNSMEMLLTLSNPVFGSYIYWSSILVIKMLLMSLLTALQRFRFKILALLPPFIRKKVFISPEDEAFTRKELVQPNDPHVDRVRRAHRNDMENILPFLTMGLLFVCVDPSPTLAMWLFRIVAAARILHTLVYAFRPVPQPTRAIMFFIAFLITMFMALYASYKTLKFI